MKSSEVQEPQIKKGLSSKLRKLIVIISSEVNGQ